VKLFGKIYLPYSLPRIGTPASLSGNCLASQGGCPVRWQGGGYSDADVRTFWGKKLRIFF